MFGRLVVGFDGSADARVPLCTAAGLADVTGADVAAVPVVPAARGETEEDRRAAVEGEAGPLARMAGDAVRRCGRPGVRAELEPIGQGDQR